MQVRYLGILFLFLALFPSCNFNEVISGPPPAPLSAPAVRGKELYIEMECFTCHGLDGSGSTNFLLTGKPRDLRHKSTYTQGTSEEAIAETLYWGLPGTAMPAFPELTDRERRLIARYISEILWEDDK